jgi:REP element-mobilizing transposase RayT
MSSDRSATPGTDLDWAKLSPMCADRTLCAVEDCQTHLIKLCLESMRTLKKPIQLTLDQARAQTGRGGWRLGAGRPKGRTKVAHVTRERFAARFPLHVTLRIKEGMGNLRSGRFMRVVRACIASAQRTEAFRVCHFNVLSNHLHLVCEAESAEKLARGMQGLCVRLARRINGAARRRGSLFSERYHSRVLKTPTEVRHVLRYVLQNGRKHAAEGGVLLAKFWVDPHSSGAWFDGWRRPVPTNEPWMRDLLRERCPTAPATTWLLATGWKRWGLLALDEAPATG